MRSRRSAFHFFFSSAVHNLKLDARRARVVKTWKVETERTAMNESFASWAMDAARSLEERYGAELLIEQTIGTWRHKHQVKDDSNYEADRLRKKDRQLNPAYEPDYTRRDAQRVEEVLPEFKTLSFSQWNDRPLRDVSWVRFCPALELLSIYQTEIRDVSPLGGLANLRALYIGDSVMADFRPLAQLSQLRTLHITAHCPWPDLAGFERLTELQEFEFMGNVLAVGVIPRLPALLRAKFHHGCGFNVPMRRISDLPEMPELRRLFLENTWQLQGLERLPHLLNLELYGYYDDLAPLAALQELTHLFLSGGEYESIAPLGRLASLRRLVLRREEPQDFTPLSELNRLHELVVELCPVNRAEVKSFNALLEPWSIEFAVNPPRPLRPLRLLVYEPGEAEPKEKSPAAPRDWGEDHEMGTSEGRWFARTVNRRLTALLGKGWGHQEERYISFAGHENVDINRPEDIDRLPEIVECLRQIIASARHPWHVLLIVDSLGRYERDLDEIDAGEDQDEDEEPFDAENERQEWEDRQERRRERRAFLERQYRLRLSRELGKTIRPQDFAPPSEPEATTADDADQDEGYDLGTRLHLYADLTETAIYVGEHSRGLAEMLLAMKAES